MMAAPSLCTEIGTSIEFFAGPLPYLYKDALFLSLWPRRKKSTYGLTGGLNVEAEERDSHSDYT
jgi:hypothetical protein